MSEHQAMTDASATSRRRLLLGVGGVGATVALAACGTDSDDGTGIGPISGGQTGGGQTGGLQSPDSQIGDSESGDGESGDGDSETDSASALTTTSEVPVGGGAIFAAQGVVVTQPNEGEFKAFSAICTHQQCPVSSVEGGTINCNCHGSKYSIENGSVTAGPAPSPLEEKTVTVDGENISVS